mmetsp:Transcript_8656/g.18488  ORF Transcript_8656/g.18488 Transcript_8656/m.18488 type:complete len:419 (-) Transcript_8656:157-1413(-)
METTGSPANLSKCQISINMTENASDGSDAYYDHHSPQSRFKEFKNDDMERFSTVSLELEILDNPRCFNESSRSFDSDEVGEEMHQLIAIAQNNNNNNYRMKIDSNESLQSSGNHSKGISINSGSPSSALSKNIGDGKNFDAQAYLDKRVMTPMQERANALTILPNMFYCMYFVLAGSWLTSEALENTRQSVGDELGIENSMEQDGWADMAQDVFGHQNDFLNHMGCINIPMLPKLYALPPLPVVAGAVGIVAHAPFSFIYHWFYATKLHPSKRVEHWSRRLDHAFIHFASACMSYATSGRMDYFLLTAAFNLDCAYRQFERRVRPRRNQIRIAISILLYTLPVLRRGYYSEFLTLVFLFLLSGWFFAAYPVGGWSHSLFHVVIGFMPHFIMTSACKLQSSQAQIEFAAKCAIAGGMHD